MSYDENRICDLIDGGLNQQNEMFNEMTKIEEILNKHFHHFYSAVEKQHVIDCMKEYSRACCKASLEKAAEKAEISISTYTDRVSGKNVGVDYKIKKSTVTNSKNITLL